MVRVLAVSDEEVPAMRSRVRDLQVDLVLGAGDLPWDYLETLVELVGAPALFVPGNHEPHIGRGTPTAPRGMVSVDGSVQRVAGLHIAGLGGCVRYNDGEHQYTQREYHQRARRLLALAGRTARVDVLLTHAPPLGLGDEDDPSHVGIEALHEVLEVLRPTWHLHGHIHPFGMLKADRQVGPTTIRNVIPWRVIDIEPQAVVGSSSSVGRSGQED
ncbi:metallophosphoesterase family protein [Aeromicrobium wangtongii]|uniref:metallophosphoesterase family protein n=1 Tax=Aeromicrobium wangtongii TaxID=2969247 RepID=UPI0020173E40|nr:metallophosphoesterase [Aeromicrobium wangtongii]MCL3818186.1 metallophosphoesterase [Aeromicrobium wangtongii]